MIELDKLFPANQVTPADPTTYPYGGFKDETDPNKTGDGTPITAEWLNDWLGFDGALMKDAALTANNKPDTASASQRLDALKKIISENISSVQTLQPKTQADVNLITILPSTTYLVIDASKLTASLTILAFKGTKTGQKFSLNIINPPGTFGISIRIYQGSSPTGAILGDWSTPPFYDFGLLWTSNVTFIFKNATQAFIDAQTGLTKVIQDVNARTVVNATGIAAANKRFGNITRIEYCWVDAGTAFAGPPGWTAHWVNLGSQWRIVWNIPDTGQSAVSAQSTHVGVWGFSDIINISPTSFSFTSYGGDGKPLKAGMQFLVMLLGGT